MYEMFASKEEIYVLLGFITSVKKMMQPKLQRFPFYSTLCTLPA